MPNTIKVLVADDDPLVRAAVRTLIKSEKDMLLVGEAVNGEEALRQVDALHPDILLLDQNMPRATGIETLRRLSGSTAPIKSILLTVFMENRDVLEALQLGARGLILKESAQSMLTKGIRAVNRGQFWFGHKAVLNTQHVVRDLKSKLPKTPPDIHELSGEERRIAQRIVEGGTDEEIAADLQISKQRVAECLAAIFDKVGVWNRLGLAIYALDHGLVDGG